MSLGLLAHLVVKWKSKEPSREFFRDWEIALVIAEFSSYRRCMQRNIMENGMDALPLEML
jgi:hypothetical protein